MAQHMCAALLRAPLGSLGRERVARQIRLALEMIFLFFFFHVSTLLCSTSICRGKAREVLNAPKHGSRASPCGEVR